MAVRFSQLTIDCADPRRLADFWSQVLDYTALSPDPDGDVEIVAEVVTDDDLIAATVAAAPVPAILFLRVPDAKRTKNRLHLDLRPVGTTRAAEVDRILGLGASRVDIGQGDVQWDVLADPEGNEFCVLNSLTHRS